MDVERDVWDMAVGDVIVDGSKTFTVEKIERSRKRDYYKVNDRYIYSPGAKYRVRL